MKHIHQVVTVGPRPGHAPSLGDLWLDTQQYPRRITDFPRKIDDYEVDGPWSQNWEHGFSGGVIGQFEPPVLEPRDPHPYNAYLQGFLSGQEYREVRSMLSGGE